MTVHELHLVWKRDGEDVELGSCFLPTRPAVGELLSYGSDKTPGGTGVWKVVLVYHHPFMHGSQTWRNWTERGEQPDSATYLWVEPTEGPWEP